MNLIDLDILDSELVEQDNPIIHITIDGEEIEAIRLDYLYSLSKGTTLTPNILANALMESEDIK